MPSKGDGVVTRAMWRMEMHSLVEDVASAAVGAREVEAVMAWIAGGGGGGGVCIDYKGGGGGGHLSKIMPDMAAGRWAPIRPLMLLCNAYLDVTCGR